MNISTSLEIKKTKDQWIRQIVDDLQRDIRQTWSDADHPERSIKAREGGGCKQEQGGHVQQVGRHGGRNGVVQNIRDSCVLNEQRELCNALQLRVVFNSIVLE